MSNEQIAEASLEELIDFISIKGKNRFSYPEEVASIAARNSYRLEKCLYEPLTIAIALSFNCLKAFEQELL